MNELKLPYATLMYEEPIVYITFKQNAELGFPELRELVLYAETLSNYKNYVVLSNVRGNVTVTPEGKKFAFESNNSPYQKGTAVLVKNSAFSLASNLYLGLKQPEFPYKVFTDEKKAVDWLLSLPLQGESKAE